MAAWWWTGVLPFDIIIMTELFCVLEYLPFGVVYRGKLIGVLEQGLRLNSTLDTQRRTCVNRKKVQVRCLVTFAKSGCKVAAGVLLSGFKTEGLTAFGV